MTVTGPSWAGRLYETTYGFLCGTPPQLRPWHFQWLATRDLYRELRRVLPTISGRVLDVGCGTKPYRPWLKQASAYVGLDVTDQLGADLVVRPGQHWPLEDASFDSVLSTQVLEHARDFEHVRAEMMRVVRPGGLVIVSVPFIYNEHGLPEDFRRFSIYGARDLFPQDWQVASLARLGGFGSTLAVLLLNWIDISLSQNWRTKVAKAILLPVWIVLSAVVNAVGRGLDLIGDRSAIYLNVLVVATKPAGDTDSR